MKEETILVIWAGSLIVSALQFFAFFSLELYSFVYVIIAIAPAILGTGFLIFVVSRDFFKISSGE